MDEKKTLFSAYMILSASENTLNNGADGPYERLKKARRIQGNRPLSMREMSPEEQALKRELNAAKKKAAKEAGMLYSYVSQECSMLTTIFRDYPAPEGAGRRREVE